MPELISSLGVDFYVFELQGSLRYSLTRHGKATINSDIEGEIKDDDICASRLANIELGIDASAVGCHLRLVKNDGLLKVKYEGRDGSTAEWSFLGLTTSGGEGIVATAATQTFTDPSKCPICGNDKSVVLEVKNRETQTEIEAMQSIGIQTKTEAAKTSTGVQTMSMAELSSPQQAQQYSPIPESSVGLPVAGTITRVVQSATIRGPNSKTTTSIDTQTGPIEKPGNHSPAAENATSSNNRKRKASSSYLARPPLHKNAKSEHNSEYWPRHLYMRCFRTTPRFLLDDCVLHIDVQEGTVWFEGWQDSKYNCYDSRYEGMAYDLKDPLSKLTSKDPYCLRLRLMNNSQS